MDVWFGEIAFWCGRYSLSNTALDIWSQCPEQCELGTPPSPCPVSALSSKLGGEGTVTFHFPNFLRRLDIEVFLFLAWEALLHCTLYHAEHSPPPPPRIVIAHAYDLGGEGTVSFQFANYPESCILSFSGAFAGWPRYPPSPLREHGLV